jgi:hypothetical protein
MGSSNVQCLARGTADSKSLGTTWYDLRFSQRL